MSRYVYHYCAHYQESSSKIAYIDGIAQLESRITTHEDLQNLKIAVCPEQHGKLTVDSLSFLGMENGNE